MKISGKSTLGERGQVLVAIELTGHPTFNWECEPKQLQQFALALNRLADVAQKTPLRAGQKPVKLEVRV